MKRILQILVIVLLAALLYPVVSEKIHRPAGTEETTAPTPAASYTPTAPPAVSERRYDGMLNEQDIEMIMLHAADPSPISDPDVSIAADGTVTLDMTLDISKLGKGKPAYLDRLVSLGLIKNDLPVHATGTLVGGDAGVTLTITDITAANIPVGKLEKTVGVNFISRFTETGEINTAINQALAKSLGARITSVEYGDGFMRLRGRYLTDGSAAGEPAAGEPAAGVPAAGGDSSVVSPAPSQTPGTSRGTFATVDPAVVADVPVQ